MVGGSTSTLQQAQGSSCPFGIIQRHASLSGNKKRIGNHPKKLVEGRGIRIPMGEGGALSGEI